MDKVAVHKSTNVDFYRDAAAGKILLFYSSRPMNVGDVTNTPERFAGEYVVPASRAFDLYDLICAEASPSKIIAELGLERAVSQERHFDMRGYGRDQLGTFRKPDALPDYDSIPKVKMKPFRLVHRGVHGLGIEEDY